MEPIIMITTRLLFCQCFYVLSHQLSISTTGHPSNGNNNNNNQNRFFPVPRARATPVPKSVPFYVPRGSEAPYTGVNLPHCSECFGHGVNKSIDPRCRFGCRGNELHSTRPFSGGTAHGTSGWIPKFGQGAKIFRKNKMSNGNSQHRLIPTNSTPFPPSISSTVRTKQSPKGQSKASSSKKLAAMRVTTSQRQQKEVLLSKYRDKNIKDKEEEAKASGLPVYDKLNKKKQEEEEVLLSYKKYIKTSSIIIVAAIFGGVAITAFVVYRKHVKRKRKIHHFQSIELA